MQEFELQNEIIRKVLETNNIDLLKKIKDFFYTMQKKEKSYKLSDSEKMLLEERELEYQKNKNLISNEDVFKEIERML